MTMGVNLSFSDANGDLWKYVQDPEKVGVSATSEPTLVGRLPVVMTDIASSLDGTTYGISFNTLYKIGFDNANNLVVEEIGSLGLTGANAFVIDPFGKAYVAANNTDGLYRVDLDNAQTTLIGNTGLTSAGDLAFHNGELWYAASNRILAQLDPTTGNVIQQFQHNISNIFGLDSDGFTLSALAGNDLFSINISQGILTKTDDFQSSGVGQIFGAASLGFGQTGNIVTGTDFAETINGSSFDDILAGFLGDDTLIGGGGDDTLIGGEGNDLLDGGLGLDVTQFSLLQVNVILTKTGVNNYQINATSSGEGIDTLIDIERLSLSDGILALDTDGIAGQVYRLYQAAFGRTPDTPGLSHNVNLVDGGLSIDSMSDAFVGSAEFIAQFGANSSNLTFVTALYQNVLDRAPDIIGFNNWNNALNAGVLDRGEVLYGFSESLENFALVGPAIEDGIWLG